MTTLKCHSSMIGMIVVLITDLTFTMRLAFGPRFFQVRFQFSKFKVRSLGVDKSLKLQQLLLFLLFDYSVTFL